MVVQKEETVVVCDNHLIQKLRELHLIGRWIVSNSLDLRVVHFELNL